LLGQGDGTFADALNVGVGESPGFILSVDLDVNGKPDLVTANADSSDLSLIFNETGDALSTDCNQNEIPDSCDLAVQRSSDINENSFPDECETDCNANGIPDEFEVSRAETEDLNGNGIPDACENDCNFNNVDDGLEIATAAAFDCNRNGIPDGCDLESGESTDCNENGVPDGCDVAGRLMIPSPQNVQVRRQPHVCDQRRF